VDSLEKAGRDGEFLGSPDVSADIVSLRGGIGACPVKGGQQWLSSFGSRLRKAAVVCCSADFLQYCGREGSGGGYAVSGQGFGGFGRGVWKGGRTAEGVCLQSREHPPVWKGMVFRVSRQGGL
jgi:hypothetical protein